MFGGFTEIFWKTDVILNHKVLDFFSFYLTIALKDFSMAHKWKSSAVPVFLIANYVLMKVLSFARISSLGMCTAVNSSVLSWGLNLVDLILQQKVQSSWQEYFNLMEFLWFKIWELLLSPSLVLNFDDFSEWGTSSSLLWAVFRFYRIVSTHLIGKKLLFVYASIILLVIAYFCSIFHQY